MDDRPPLIRMCRLQPEGRFELIDVPDTGMGLHEALGGYVETFPLPYGLHLAGLIGMADEDGLRKQLPYNYFSEVLGQNIVGPVLIAANDPPEFISLGPGQEDMLRRIFEEIAQA